VIDLWSASVACLFQLWLELPPLCSCHSGEARRRREAMPTDRQIAATARALLNRTAPERHQVLADAYNRAVAGCSESAPDRLDWVSVVMTNYVAAVYREIERLGSGPRGS
jgi:hypothetical protein